MPATSRIDVHHHVLPSFYIEAQRAAGLTGTAVIQPLPSTSSYQLTVERGGKQSTLEVGRRAPVPVLAAGVGLSAGSLRPTQVRITVVELELTTRINFDIYTLKDAPQKLRDHEEAHRRIGEYYYKNSATVATDIGRALHAHGFIWESETPAFKVWRCGDDLPPEVYRRVVILHRPTGYSLLMEDRGPGGHVQDIARGERTFETSDDINMLLAGCTPRSQP